MKISHNVRMLSLIAGVLALPAIRCVAEEQKTAQQIMDFSAEKMSGYKSWSGDYTQTMKMLGAEMAIKGQMVQQQPRMMRMQMDMPMMGQNGKMLMVLGADGILWQEMDMAGQKRVMKMDMAKVMSNVYARTGIKMDPLQDMDPSKQWQASKTMFDFTAKPDGEIHGEPAYILEGTLKDGAMTNQQMAAMAAMIGKSRVYISQKDGFVRRMEQFDKSQTNIAMTIEFANLKFNPPIADGTFDYQPPKDIQVMDMTDIAGAHMGSGGSAPSRPPPPPPPPPPPGSGD